MVARLKLQRQSTHWVEVAWQIKTNKTQFHKCTFVGDWISSDRFVILEFQFRCVRTLSVSWNGVQSIDIGECIATARATDFSLPPMSSLHLPLSVDERAQPFWPWN
jgi:hypothetical protein